MTGSLLLDWPILAVSLFDTILALWLGLTVLLSAERRTWGIWLASGGLLMGGLFFVSHTAILGQGPIYLPQGIELWWQVGWLPVIALPLAWYVLTLWYAGLWGDGSPNLPFWKRVEFAFTAPLTGSTRLHRRQRPWFILTALLAAGLVGLLVFANALPSFGQIIQLNLATTPAIAGVPVLILVYPFYILLCIALSLDVLRRPEPSPRMMGELARRRARPWLIAVSIALLTASLLVALVMAWVALNARHGPVTRIYANVAFGVAWFDLTIASLIGAAIVLLGQAIVSYELFTGRSLPRRGFLRHWRRAVILAAGYGMVVGGGLALKLRPIYSLLLTVVIMVAFYALLVWRSFTERERYIEHLRPFVTSQRLYERLLVASAPPDVDAVTLFRALCEDVLGARLAYLAALGPLAPLAGPPLVHADDLVETQRAVSLLPEIVAQFDSPQTMCMPLDPDRYGGATWAVPLWSERGLTGVLLLGEKRDGGLYTQEEIEIARASGERLIDTQAGAEMARRLMALQRQRLAESQVIDQRARRVLHDDVLPRLHATMLTLSGGEADSDMVALLAETHRQIADLLHEMPTATAPEVARLGLIGALRQAVDEEFKNAFDNVTWRVEPDAEQQAQSIPSLTAEVLFYAAREAIRNAAHHGRDTDAARPLHLRVGVACQDGLQISIEDDGVGIGMASRSDESGGHGLALHSTMMAVVGGTLAVESTPGAYTRVTLRLPQGAW
jgi:signal transduction histidine kinase